MPLALTRHTKRASRAAISNLRLLASMSTTAPTAQRFRLALVQTGGVTADKSHNLAHARGLIIRASNPEDGRKPGVVVLPVSWPSAQLAEKFSNPWNRNASIRLMDTFISQTMRRKSAMYLERNTIYRNRRVKASKCYPTQRERQACGS